MLAATPRQGGLEMRYGRVVRAIALLGVLVWAAGCSDGDEEARSSAPPTASTPATTGTPSSSSSKPAYYDNGDNVLMAKGDCYGPPRGDEQGHAVEMPCDDPDAIGKVLKRVEKKTTVYTYIDVSDSTDDVLGISGDPGWEVAVCATTSSTWPVWAMPAYATSRPRTPANRAKAAWRSA